VFAHSLTYPRGAFVAHAGSEDIDDGGALNAFSFGAEPFVSAELS
jgi:hypothetical protein